MEWARQHQHRRRRDWRHALFSDESRYLLHRASGIGRRVCREAGQRFQEDCVLPTVAHGGGSVHVWGAIHCSPWCPNLSCALAEKYHWRHLQAAAGDRNAFLCQGTMLQLTEPVACRISCTMKQLSSCHGHLIRLTSNPLSMRGMTQTMPFGRERSRQRVWVNWLMLSPRNGMHSPRYT